MASSLTHTPKRNSEVHRAKMARKTVNRGKATSRPLVRHGDPRKPNDLRLNGRPWFPASINRRTGKPHQHKREIARRLGAA